MNVIYEMWDAARLLIAVIGAIFGFTFFLTGYRIMRMSGSSWQEIRKLCRKTLAVNVEKRVWVEVETLDDQAAQEAMCIIHRVPGKSALPNL